MDSLSAARGSISYQIFRQKAGSAGSQFLEVVAGKVGKGAKCEVFNDKKVYKKMFFSVITKNLDWKILTKNLVTFKRWDEFKDEKF